MLSSSFYGTGNYFCYPFLKNIVITDEKNKLHYFTMVNRQSLINFQRKERYIILFFLSAVFLFPGCRNHDYERTWSVYKADAESSSYSPLKEINKENVHQLKLAWTFNPEDGAEVHGMEAVSVILSLLMALCMLPRRVTVYMPSMQVVEKNYGHLIHLTVDRGRIFSRCYLLGRRK
jgi:hypothetical protein